MSAAAAAAFLVFVISAATAAAVGSVGDPCSTDAGCGAGLHCDSCGGSMPSACTRIAPADPKRLGTGLPFNRYSWLTTHNSYAMTGSKTAILSPVNQEDTVTSQLQNGVRGLMLDMYDFENDIWLCHSFQGICYNFTAFQPAINVLKEINTFLSSNPNEVITIFIEDYTAPGNLTTLFTAAGLMEFWFPVSQMPKNGGDWPLLSDMISKNERLLVFTSKKAKEANEGIAYNWNYVLENQYGDGGMVSGSCPNRAESPPMNATTQSLICVNYFPTDPVTNDTAACAENSAPLLDMLQTCHDQSGNRWANYIAVDFYMRSDGGGAPLATDVANGHLVCGCGNIAYCRVNATYGTCVVPPPPPPPPRPPSSQRASPATLPSNTPNAAALCGSCRWGWVSGGGASVLALLMLMA